MASFVMPRRWEVHHRGGHLSFGGGLMQLEKIRLVKMINPNVEIGWDGGVMVDNAYSLVQGGVNILNVGGTIHAGVVSAGR